MEEQFRQAQKMEAVGRLALQPATASCSRLVVPSASIASRIMELHSKSLLPRAYAGATGSAGSEAKPVKTSGDGVILVVEDELAVRKLLTRVLAKLGYTVLGAANGLEALEIARRSSKRVRLVLTDVVMPKMSGAELVEKLLSQFPEMKVLLTSGYTGGEFPPIDGMPLLQKPFSPQVLADKLRQVLGDRA